MAGQPPLIVVNALVRRAKTSLGSNERVEVEKINLGGFNTINVSTDTITVTRNLHFVQNAAPNGTQNVDNILGGEEGDLLIVSGDRVRFRSNGNIRLKSNYVPNNQKTLTMLFDGVEWLELARA